MNQSQQQMPQCPRTGQYHQGGRGGAESLGQIGPGRDFRGQRLRLVDEIQQIPRDSPPDIHSRDGGVVWQLEAEEENNKRGQPDQSGDKLAPRLSGAFPSAGDNRWGVREMATLAAH